MQIISKVTGKDEHFVRGHRLSRRSEDHPWVMVPNSEWVQLNHKPWFTLPAVDMLRVMGIETTEARATNFSEAAETLDAFYYVSAATPPGSGDEALKWIMGNLAAVLNERGLNFRSLSILPADWLRAFVRDLLAGKFERNFAKPIFAELIDAPKFRETPEGTLSVTGDEIMSEMVSDPRFKAADGGAIDDMIEAVIAANPDQVEKARENPKLVQWFVGQVMKASKGKAPAATVMEKLNARLAPAG